MLIYLPDWNIWSSTPGFKHVKVHYTTWANQRFKVAKSGPTLCNHGLQHVRSPCPSSAPGVYSNSCPSSRWCHPAISPCRPLLLLPPVPPSIKVFSSESTLRMRWPKYWSFSLSISPSNKHPGLISFRMDRLDLLVVQGILKSLLQHHSSKHQFFSAQLSSQSNSNICT